MIHDKIQNCSIDKTKIMMIEKNRAKRGGPQKMFFFFSKKLGGSLMQTKNTFYQFRSFAPFVTD